MESTEQTSPPQSEAPPADASPLALVALRDLALVAAALSLFAAADAWHQLTGTLLSGTLALIDGLLVGLAVGALAHEWGHFVGARVSGAVAPLRRAQGFLPLFDFDYSTNSPSQFQSMSVGGNIAHWLVVGLFLFGLPLTTNGQVAIASGALGFAIFASTIEFPVIRSVARGATGPEALASIAPDFLTRHGRYGLVAALVAFLVL